MGIAGQGIVGGVDAGVESDRRDGARGIRFDDADAERLAEVAGIFDFQQMRQAGLGSRQRIRDPSGIGRGS